MKKIIITFLLAFGSQYCFAQYWDSLRGGTNRNITCLYTDTISDRLFVGGIFTMVDHQNVKGFASWKTNQWTSYGDGIDSCTMCSNIPSTWAIERFDSCIYIGGNFRQAGEVWSPAFAKWNGTYWDSVPGAKINLMDGSVIRGMHVFNNELYICGTFDSVGATAANQIAKWNGVSWGAIGTNYNFNGLLNGIIFYNSNLYVSGSFDDPQGNFCHLAKWDGQNWRFFTTEIQGGLAGIWDMEVYQNELYIGGLFYTTDGNAGTDIMRWNDTLWRDVAGGSVEQGSNFAPTIKDMCIHNGLLWCVGSFEKIGGITANYVASWNGTNWCGYGTTNYGGVEYIAFYHDTMYLGGGFVELEGDTAWYIARWIGGGPDTCGNTTGITEPAEQLNLNVFPNPTDGTVWIQGLVATGEELVIEIYNIAGQLMYSETLSPRIYLNRQLFLEGYSSGLYVVYVRSGNLVLNKKIIIQH